MWHGNLGWRREFANEGGRDAGWERTCLGPGRETARGLTAERRSAPRPRSSPGSVEVLSGREGLHDGAEEAGDRLDRLRELVG